MVDSEADGIGDWESTGFIPVRDALIGETDADNFRHTIVRTAFMEEFWKDERVQALVSRWAQRTGLEERALRLARAGDRLAELAGLDSRGELMGRDELIIDEDQLQEVQEAMAEYQVAFDAYVERLSHPDEETDVDVFGEAREFITNLGLPYPWLAIELIGYTYHAISGMALGRVMQIDSWYEPAAPSEVNAPSTSMTFQTEEGESVEEAVGRLLREAEDTVEKLLEPLPARGRVPDRTIPVLERNARWLYRHKVKGESIRSIAINEFGSSDRRKDIYDGIQRAEELLELTQYTF